MVDPKQRGPKFDWVCHSNQSHPIREDLPVPEGRTSYKCPECKGPMRKKYSLPFLTFKGDGWARKDR